MSIWDKIFGELVDVIEWTDHTQHTMVYRFPRYGNEIKNGAMLTVREGQTAVLVNEGEVADVFEPGLYELSTANVPILSSLQGWKHGFESPFKAEVYFFNTKVFTDMKWGLRNPLILRDREFGVIRVRAFGSYAFRINDPHKMISEIVGTDGHFVLEEIVGQLKNLVVTGFAKVISESGIPILDIAANYDDLGQFLTAQIQPMFAAYGLSLETMLVENVSVPESVEKALDERASSIAVGDLNRFTRYQQAQSMRDAANNESGAAGGGMAMGMGFGMAQSFGQALAKGDDTDPLKPPPMPESVKEVKQYFAVLDGKRVGPMTLPEVASRILNAEINGETLMWTAGLDDWVDATALIEVQRHLDSMPPDLPE
ncbi:SPFH domain-containing protein [Marinicella sp. S1101]|uniref:SPFH domain-containing protein n=1 Tax=Marinicella marina TaxID=2996016 RepID=UPI002260BB88|nr:SPFH domain-containing protein [Marinicella marina]MCX7553551.1 SPFH domain-containing protein [Marinicella marina]MDJ1140175.1 SPFH domain-containing protein [Marinicella marina]